MTTPAASPAPAFYRRRLPKPDGRALFLYARQPISEDIRATCPRDDAPVPPNPHLRWHLVRGEWVAYAGHRQNRTFLPPAEFNPLAPTTDPHNPTELPSGGYDAAVFENRFPTLYAGAHDPPSALVPTLPARGASEVVVYAQDPRASLGTLPLDHVGLVIDAWADRYDELGARDGVAYVFPFENRGVEVGVTLHQPHGQIYAYPFVPPVAARELEQQRAHYAQTGRGLLEDYARDERADGRRILQVTDTVVSVVPVCARNAYEMWILPARPAPSLSALNPAERRDFARALSTAVRTLDALWGRPMPYVLVIHQAPTDGLPHPEAHVDAEVYPAYRMPSRLKYLAGSELGAGTFTADTLPEDKAVELRAAGGAS